jgi:hypothetical protein
VRPVIGRRTDYRFRYCLRDLAEQLGIPNADAGGATGLTNFSISGLVGLGDGSGSLKKPNNNSELNHAVSLVKSSHELKVGFDWRSLRFAFYSPGISGRKLYLQRRLCGLWG